MAWHCAANLPRPTRARIDRASGFKQQPQTFDLGNAARSTNRIFKLRRDNSYAASEPERPAPMTTASHWRCGRPELTGVRVIWI
jgi:hypothetical protein